MIYVCKLCCLVSILRGNIGVCEQPPIETGFAPRYSPGLMRKVAIRRGLEPRPCMISRIDGPIGGFAWVHGLKTDKWLYCLIVDVSAPKDRKRHIQTKRIIEVSHENALAICGSTRNGPKQCPVEVQLVKQCNTNGYTVRIRIN